MVDQEPAGGIGRGNREDFAYDVFLSYASADHEAVAEIYRTLGKGGLRVFWAPDTITAGRNFVDALNAGLLGSRHFVLYWTAQARESRWVRDEHNAFYNQIHTGADDARLLVILLDGREPTSSLPVLLRNLQVARSVDQVVAQLGIATSSSDRIFFTLPKNAIGRASEPPAGTPIHGPLGMSMHFVPSGTYVVGSPASEPGRLPNEVQHAAILSRGFCLGETPVTQAQWQQALPGGWLPSRFKAGGGQLPVENINWFEAIEFANKLSDQEGLAPCYRLVDARGTLGRGDFTCEDVIFAGLDCPGYRLPTEAEWEVAARAGTPTALYSGDLTLRGLHNGPELNPIAWYGGNSEVSYDGAFGSTNWREMQFPAARSGPHPVRQKAPNSWGFYDLLGNVFEWAGDWIGSYNSNFALDPIGPSEGSHRVVRGGSWYSQARFVRAALRYGQEPSKREFHLGFRLARSHCP